LWLPVRVGRWVAAGRGTFLILFYSVLCGWCGIGRVEC
jgi:hypothetical protein